MPNNAYGFPYPNDTDPYKDTPAALAALRDAVNPKLGNLPIKFLPAASRPTDANGDFRVDLTAYFTAITGAVVTDCNNDGYAPHYQFVNAGDPAGWLRVRVLSESPDGAVVANGTRWASIAVWGTPKP